MQTNRAAEFFAYAGPMPVSVGTLHDLVGMTDARIPWPLARSAANGSRWSSTATLPEQYVTNRCSAICHWFGVHSVTVWRWRKSLDVPKRNYGTKKLWENRLADGSYLKGLRVANSRRPDPIGDAKRAIAQRGKPSAPHVMEAAGRARLGDKLSDEHRQRLREVWIRRRAGKCMPAGGY
jgi:hypothetical protein